jgi:hypothetical protein
MILIASDLELRFARTHTGPLPPPIAKMRNYTLGSNKLNFEISLSI